MDEVWKDVPYEPFNERYEVSSLGRVRSKAVSVYSCSRCALLKPSKAGNVNARYSRVSLYCRGQSKSVAVHRMVCLAFLGDPPDGKPYACHRDDDRGNNTLTNLYWGDESDNHSDRVKNGRDLSGERNGRAILTISIVRSIRAEYALGGVTQTALALRYGVDQTQISTIIRRKQWRDGDQASEVNVPA